GTMKTLLEHWTDTAGNNSGPTIPAREPNKRIDYLLAHAKHGSIKLLRSEVLNEPIASDHRPVAATIEISR
ncbi:MAG: endonuclease/exonuclease/phosphatase family protein, partial [Limisphaerales bacterium]